MEGMKGVAVAAKLSTDYQHVMWRNTTTHQIFYTFQSIDG